VPTRRRFSDVTLRETLVPRKTKTLSLTSRLDTKDDPIRLFLHERFPNTRPLINDLRQTVVGVETIRPELTVPWFLLGHAIDYRIRGYFMPLKFPCTAEWVLQGAESDDSDEDLWETWEEISRELERQALEIHGIGRRLEQREEEWLARLCVILAMFEVYYRAAVIVLELQAIDSQNLTVQTLLAIPEQHWVEDLCAMSWAFYKNSHHMLNEPVVLNPSFEGSGAVGGADADLILNHCLLEVKATISFKRSRPEWLYQLLGYTLLDFSNQYEIASVGFYLPRQVQYIRWPLSRFLSTFMGSEAPPLAVLRAEFKQVTQLPRV